MSFITLPVKPGVKINKGDAIYIGADGYAYTVETPCANDVESVLDAVAKKLSEDADVPLLVIQ